MPSSVFSETAVFISAVILINSEQLSGLVIFPDDLCFVAPATASSSSASICEKKALTFATCLDASTPAASSATACSCSACFSAAICLLSSTSAAAASTSFFNSLIVFSSGPGYASSFSMLNKKYTLLFMVLVLIA